MKRWVLSVAVLSSLFAFAGCRRDECQRARSHLEACLQSYPPEGLDVTGRCEGPTLCGARCINALECSAARRLFDGKEIAPEGDAAMRCLFACAEEAEDAAVEAEAAKKQTAR